jgi:hypothetical protein
MMISSNTVFALMLSTSATFAQVRGPSHPHIARQAQLAGSDSSLAGISKDTLTQKWWNWNVCNDAFDSTGLAPQDALVPKNVVFLAGSSLSTCSSTATRHGNIPKSTKLVLMPLINEVWHSVDNNAVAGDVCSPPGYRNTTDFADSVGFYSSALQNMTNYRVQPFAQTNGPLEEFWSYTAAPFYYQTCPNGHKLNDTCDNPVSQDVGGQDAYPNYGWWAADTKAWRCGESREYSFGANYVYPGDTTSFCPSVKITLKATCPGFFGGVQTAINDLLDALSG